MNLQLDICSSIYKDNTNTFTDMDGKKEMFTDGDKEIYMDGEK